jgi:hypothetical protein
MRTTPQKTVCFSEDIPRVKNCPAELDARASQCTVADLNRKNMPQHHEQRSDLPRTLHEAEVRRIVEAGGGRYVGLMNEIPGKVESIVLFTSPQTRSTLALPSSRLTVEAVREQLDKSDAAFNDAASK